MARSKPDEWTLGTLKQALGRGELASLYLLYGEEDLLVDEAVQLVVDRAVDEAGRSFNLDVVHGSEVDAGTIVMLATSFPMMGERRVVVVRDVDRVSNKEQLLPLVDRPPETTVLILVAARADFRVKLFKTAKSTGVAIEFRTPYENELPAWIHSRIRQLGKDAPLEACQLLQTHVRRSLREIQNEIDKLFIYVGEKKRIDVEDVANVVGASRQYTIFELQKAIGQQNMDRALVILTRMLNSGESPTGMIVMLTRYFEKLWLLHDPSVGKLPEAALATVLGIVPYFVREYKEAAQRYSSDQIEECFGALTDSDEILKSSTMDARLAMTLLVYRLVRPGVPTPASA